MRRTALSIVAAGAAVGLALAPSAAMAAPAVFVYTWEDGALIQYTDPVAGAGDVVPTSEAIFEIAGLDVSGTGAGFAVPYDEEAHLFSVNVLTGDVADLGPLTFEGEPISSCTGLDLTGGVLTIACDVVPDQVGESHILTVDPTTLAATLVVSSTIRVASIATDPSDGQLYGFSYIGEIVALSAGSAEQVGTVTNNRTLWGADFANDGSLWGAISDPTETIEVGSWVFYPAATEPEGGDFVENLTAYEPTPPAPQPVPQLAATGSEPAPALFAAVALMVVGAGIAVAVSVRRRAA
jgi:hypothetical protein